MMKEIAKEVKKYVACNIKDRRKVNFDILVGRSQIIQLKEFNDEYDGRLENEDYLNHSFTIIVYVEKTNKIIGKATFFILDDSIWKEIFFWKQNGDILQKEKLNNFIKDTGKECIIMGYGQISNDIRHSDNFSYKGKIIEYYYSVLKFLLKRRESMLYCEPCGCYYLSNQILESDELKVSDFDYEKIGRVCAESVVSEKIVKHLHFKRLDLCYHYLTLGPIYCKWI